MSAGQRVLTSPPATATPRSPPPAAAVDVTATDYVAELLDGTAARAAAESLAIECREADAEALPFADDSFDVVLSTFGVMFTPNQDQAAAELQRVCRPGRQGRARQLDAVRVHRPDVQDRRQLRAPSRRACARRCSGAPRIASPSSSPGQQVDARTRQFVFRYRSASHWLDTFRTYYGPTLKAFGALDDAGRAAFERDLIELAESHNTATDGTLRVPSDYLEVVVTVR